MSEKRTLYHTGYEEIRQPDVHYGRVNADFGQGFYLTDDPAFAARWAKDSRGCRPVMNTYELDLTGLTVLHLTRDEEWFRYLFANRRSLPDAHPEADVIIGPIANDTLYDTLGIMTSGFLSDDQALQLLLIGPLYQQIVLKTKKAAAQLAWRSAREIAPDETAGMQEILAREQEDYQRLLGETLEAM